MATLSGIPVAVSAISPRQHRQLPASYPAGRQGLQRNLHSLQRRLKPQLPIPLGESHLKYLHAALQCASLRLYSARTGAQEIMAILFKQGRTAALSIFGLLSLVVTLAFAAPARAIPTSEAPVYAIDNYPFQKAPALMRWRSVQQREAQLMARANPDECKDGEPRLDCAAKESLLLEEKLQDKSPADQVEAVYAYFNAIKWREHAPDCGVDCWKTRLEFL